MRFTVGGIVIGVTAGFAAWIWPSQNVLIALILSLVTAIIGQCIDLRINSGSVEAKLDQIAPIAALEQRIAERCEKDPLLRARHQALMDEIHELADGGYTVHGLEDVYADDIRQIRKLQKGEKLRSSCPIANTSVEGTLEQIRDRNYIRSMSEHIKASKRGVSVMRLYFFRSTDMFSDEMMAHLQEIPAENHEVRVIFRDKLPTDTDIDFLVFGDHTVSMGMLNIVTGICKGTRVTQRRNDVDAAIARFDAVWDFALSLKEVAGELDVEPQ